MVNDPHMQWDGQRWLRWDGENWLDATSGLPAAAAGAPEPPAPAVPPTMPAPAVPPTVPPPATPTPQPTGSNSVKLALIIVGCVLAVMVVVVGVVAVSVSRNNASEPTGTPSPTASNTPTPTATGSPTPTLTATSTPTVSPVTVAEVKAAAIATDAEMSAYSTSVSKAAKAGNLKPALAHLDAAQQALAGFTAVALTVAWPATETDTLASADQIAAFETAAGNWIAVEREFANALQGCIKSDDTADCAQRLAKRMEAREAAATAAYQSAWVAIGGTLR